MPKKPSDDPVTLQRLQWRRDAGAYIKATREHAGLVQKDVAKIVEFDYPGRWGDYEQGKIKLPTDKIVIAAKLFGVRPEIFAYELLRRYDPPQWTLLFGDPDVRQLFLLKASPPTATVNEERTDREAPSAKASPKSTSRASRK